MKSRSFSDTPAATVDPTPEYTNYPVKRMEQLVGETFTVNSFEKRETKFGLRELLTIDLQGETHQVWASARVNFFQKSLVGISAPPAGLITTSQQVCGDNIHTVNTHFSQSNIAQ